MVLYLKNKYISLGDSSFVCDELGNRVYNIKGRIISPTHVKFICDVQGNKLFKVRNKFINFFVYRAYVYDGSGHKIAKIKDKFFNVNKEYIVEGYQDEIRTEGAFFSFSTTIYKNDVAVGKITRQIDLRDSFRVEADEKDMPFILALVTAIDNIIDKRAKKDKKR